MYKGTKIFRNHMKNVFKNDSIMRSKHFNEGFNLQKFRQTSKSFHKPQMLEYPATKQLPLPLNIKDLASSEKLKFSPQRSRDISASYISTSTSSFTDVRPESRLPVDDRTECYDCSGAINLSSAMQTNVPFPFVSRGKPIHLNMPGAQWRQKEKYVSGDLNNVHHINTRELNPRSGTSLSPGHRTGFKKLYYCTSSNDLNLFTSPYSFISNFNTYQLRMFCTAKQNAEPEKDSGKNNVKSKFRKSLRHVNSDYLFVMPVLHLVITGVTFESIYFAISRGVDMSDIMKYFGADEGGITAALVGPPVIAYALYKSLWPVRYGLTVGLTPLVVTLLRKKGIFKYPKPP